jgi:hypothetical protein
MNIVYIYTEFYFTIVNIQWFLVDFKVNNELPNFRIEIKAQWTHEADWRPVTNSISS